MAQDFCTVLHNTSITLFILDAADFQKEVTMTFNDMFITQTASQNQLIFVPLEYCNALL